MAGIGKSPIVIMGLGIAAGALGYRWYSQSQRKAPQRPSVFHLNDRFLIGQVVFAIRFISWDITARDWLFLLERESDPSLKIIMSQSSISHFIREGSMKELT